MSAPHRRPAPPQQSTILVIATDPLVRRLVRRILETADRTVIAYTLVPNIPEILRVAQPDVIVLDIPDITDFELVHDIRAHTSIPIIVLSPTSSLSDYVRAREFGADAYLTKPYHAIDLKAVVVAQLRRVPRQPMLTPAIVQIGPLTIDLTRQQVSMSQIPVELTVTEYRLLSYLAERAGEPVSVAALVAYIWGDHASSDATELHIHMQRLQGKLGADVIIALPGLGYMLSTNLEADSGLQERTA